MKLRTSLGALLLTSTTCLGVQAAVAWGQTNIAGGPARGSVASSIATPSHSGAVRYVSTGGDLGANIQAASRSLGGPGEIIVEDGSGSAKTVLQLGSGQRLVLGAGVYSFLQILLADSTTASVISSQIVGKGQGITTLQCINPTLSCITSPHTEELIGSTNIYGAQNPGLSHLTVTGGKYNWRVYGQHQTLDYVDFSKAEQDNLYIEHNECISCSVPNLDADNLTTISHVRAYLAGHNAATLAGINGQYDNLEDFTAVRYGCWGVETTVPITWHQGFTVGIGTKVCGGLHLKANVKDAGAVASLKGANLELGSDAGNGIVEDAGTGEVLLANSLITGNPSVASTAPAATLSGTGNLWSNVQISGAWVGLDFGRGGGGSFQIQFQGNGTDIQCSTMSAATTTLALFNGASRNSFDKKTCGTPLDNYSGLKGLFFSSGILVLSKLPDNFLDAPAGRFDLPELPGTVFSGTAQPIEGGLAYQGVAKDHYLYMSNCRAGTAAGGVDNLRCPGVIYAGSSADSAHTVCTQSNGYCRTLVGSLRTTSATVDSLTIVGMTPGGHCSITPTNATAATDWARGAVYLSQKAVDQIKLTHTAVAGETFDVSCTPY